jgi:hypothetical protein
VAYVDGSDPCGREDGMTSSLAKSQSPVFLGLIILCGMMVAATLVLWAHYGTAVFFETIRAGIAACF